MKNTLLTVVGYAAHCIIIWHNPGITTGRDEEGKGFRRGGRRGALSSWCEWGLHFVPDEVGHACNSYLN